MRAEIQKAIYERLSGYSDLTDLLAKHPNSGDPGWGADVPAIYAYVPQPAEPEKVGGFPYITIGEDRFDAWNTDTSDGLEAEIAIHVWSRQRGISETNQIMDEIYNALQRHELSVEGANAVLLDHATDNVMRDDDGVTHHAVCEYRLLIDRDL